MGVAVGRLEFHRHFACKTNSFECGRELRPQTGNATGTVYRTSGHRGVLASAGRRLRGPAGDTALYGKEGGWCMSLDGVYVSDGLFLHACLYFLFCAVCDNERVEFILLLIFLFEK